MSPGTGTPGTPVTLTGSGFGAAGTVDFTQGSTSVAATGSAGAWSATQVTVDVPSGLQSGSATVSLFNAVAQEPSSNTQYFTVEAGPADALDLAVGAPSVEIGGTTTVTGAVYDGAGQPLGDATVDRARRSP